jgi:hypothetical protein
MTEEVLNELTIFPDVVSVNRLASDAACNFADEDRSAALTFRGGFGGLPSGGGIFVQADVLCEAVVYQCGILKSQFFVPRAIVDFRGKDLLKSADRKIVSPVWHEVVISSELTILIRYCASLLLYQRASRYHDSMTDEAVKRVARVRIRACLMRRKR